MCLARSSPTVLTRFMDASSRGLQRPHSGTPRPPGASTPSRHQIVQRLARWLVLAHDRLDADEEAVTHAALSQALGVRRASITEAVRELDQAGAVHATRRCIAILSRAKLEGKTCGCYGVISTTVV